MSTLEPPRRPQPQKPETHWYDGFEISTRVYSILTVFFVLFLIAWGSWGFGAAVEVCMLFLIVPIALGRYTITHMYTLEDVDDPFTR